MHNSTVPRALLASVLLSASATAQFTHEATIPWDTTALGSAGVLSRTTAVDVTGDGRLDLFVRGGSGNNQIVFFDGIWNGSGSLNTGVVCHDFDGAPRQGPTDVSALAFVNATGLNLLRRNALDAGTFEFLPPTNLSEGGWINAKMVRTGDVDGAGTLDYVGVKADGRTLIVRANGGPTNIEVDVGRDILDVVLVNWVGGAAREIAVLSHQGVEIRTGSLTAIDALGVSGHTSKSIAALAVPNETVDRLAWIGTKVATGLTHFGMLKQAAPRVVNLFQLDDLDVTASRVSAADVDGDGDTDVIVSRTSSAAPWYLPSAAYLEPTWFAEKWEVTVPNPSLATGQVALGRFANDDTSELVIPTYTATTAALELFSRAVLRNGSADVFQFTPDAYEDDPEVTFEVVTDPQLREVGFQLNFLDEMLAPPASGQPENRRIEVAVWQVAESGVHVQPSAEFRYWIDWPTDTPYTNLLVDGIRIPLPAANSENCAMVPRFIEVRQIRVTSNWAVIQSGQTYTFGLSRGELDYDTYWPSETFHEFTPLLQTPGEDESHFSCPGQTQTESPVHASAIVIRRKPNPITGQGVPLPLPSPGGTAIPVPN